MNRTPTPWTVLQVDLDDGKHGFILRGTNGVNIASTRRNATRDKFQHIVRCVNSHAALVAALREACDLIDILGRECSDRVYDGERGNPVTADKFRAALAALDKEPA